MHLVLLTNFICTNKYKSRLWDSAIKRSKCKFLGYRNFAQNRVLFAHLLWSYQLKASCVSRPKKILILDRLLNIGFRITTLTTRFAFVFVLAKFLDPALVGYYGLFTASIGYALYLVGLDFYTYATREIIRAPAEQRGPMIKGQIALSGGLYVLVLPGSLLVLGMADWPGYLYWWFAPILVLEYLNQEISRLLIALSRQVTASMVLFLRQGSWAIAIVSLFALAPQSRNLDIVFAMWTASGIAAAGLGAWKLSLLQMAGWRLPVDWHWVRQGIAVSMGFLLATLALRGIQTFDRYWIEHLGGVELVAAYVLFIGMAGSLLVFPQPCGR